MSGRFIEEKIQPIQAGLPRADHLKARLSAIFKKCILTSSQLREKEVTERRKYLGEWCREGDLGFIFAQRGRGKTWLGMDIAKALARGNKTLVGPWETGEEALSVLYIDGEMSLDATKFRERALPGEANQNLHFLHHSVVFEEAEASLNLTDKMTQEVVTEAVMGCEAKVLILDNLSSLFYGLSENDNDDWGMVLPWLLNLRRRGICVIIIHHAGRSGKNMRGGSKREDPAHWIMRLDASIEGEPEKGARFTAIFDKCRNCPQESAQPVDFYYRPKEGGEPGEIEVEWRVVDNLEQFKICIRDMDMDTAGDIAEQMGVSPGYVSKLARKAEKAGWCRIQDRRYLFVEYNPK